MNLQQATETIEQLKKENQELRKRCDDLEKRLRVYESPQIPSSKHVIREVKIKLPPKKMGAPEGHKGTTRIKPEASSIVEVKPKSCPNCDGQDFVIVRKRKKTAENIKIVKIATEFHFYDCHCNKCNADFTTMDSELPREGKFGPDISALWTMVHYKGTVPFERLSEISENCHDTGITMGGLHNVIYRNAQIFKPQYERIFENVRKSKNAKSDETSISFNGKTYWLWNISSGNDTLVLIRNSRGSKVLVEVFGEFFDGVLSSDCFSAYGKFNAREYQKCWGHVLVDAKDLARHCKEGDELYKELSKMYDYIKIAKERNLERSPKVKRWVSRKKKLICSLIGKNYESKAVMNLVLRLIKYKDDWFTCLKYKDVEPTNNSSERDIRKNVISRKISGAHRSELGMRSREIMMSVILTAEKKGQNPFELVLNGIRNHNLGL